MMSKYFLKLSVLLYLNCSIISGQKIVNMNGTYDLDGDNMLEFISLELNPDKDIFPKLVRYYEIDADGYQTVIWEFIPPVALEGDFVDAEIGDVNGDGVPELVVVMNLTRFGDNSTPHVFIATYDWDGTHFSEIPSASLDIGKENKSLRCNNFQLLDQDADGEQEIVLSLGSPFRGFAIVNSSPTGLSLIKKIRPDQLLVGSGLLYVAALDYDYDGYDDVVAFSPDGNIVKAQPFYNIGGVFDSGHLVKKEIDGLNGILTHSLELTDWDSDGFSDVLISFNSGDIIALTLTPATLVIDLLPITSGPLTQVCVADFNQDTYKDVLTLSSAINALTLISGKDGGVDNVENAMRRIPDEMQVFSMLPLLKSGVYNGSVLLSGWDGSMNSTYVIQLGKKSDKLDQGYLITSDFIQKQLPSLLSVVDDVQPEISERYIEIDPTDNKPLEPQQEQRIITDLGESPSNYIPNAIYLNQKEGKVLKEQPRVTIPKKIVRTLEAPKMPKPKESIGQKLPKHVLPRYVLRPGEPFLYEIPKDSSDEFYSFRWESQPPKGMYFLYESKAINWIPSDKQLDAFPISYMVRMKIDEIMEATTGSNEDSQVFKATPVLESRDESIWVYVNDPPRFLTEPSITEFIAGSKFSYEPIIQDRNKDANIKLELEACPDGMVIENNTIYWETDSSHVEVYDVRIIASDGFERTAQEFQLFSRAGVKILSSAPKKATVGEKYSYAIKVWKQKADQKISYKLFTGPEGMILHPDGTVSWIPNPLQVDTIKYSIIASHGVATDSQYVSLFVNHPPVIKNAPIMMNKISVGGIWDFEIDVYDPNKNDPLVFTANILPQGMRMDPHTGFLRWEPTMNELDFHKLEIEISDGHESRIIESEFFVNSPINIVSVPGMSATVGEEYTYPLIINDKNRGSLLPFKRVVKIEDLSSIRMYSINITDDVSLANIDRFLGDWHNADAIYFVDPKYPADSLVSRLNLKRYTHSVFFEDDRLWVLLETLDGRTIKVKDFLWEFFHGNKGKPPRVIVERVSPTRYSLLDFPQGMEIDRSSGTIRWTPTVDQTDAHRVTVVASDGYSKDEQTFEIYANQLPTIVSNPPHMGLVGELFKYQVRVDDKNENASLEFTLMKGPHGMQMDRYGKILWVPKAAQINNNTFEVAVSDGFGTDTQIGKIFVNNAPTVVSNPKPVGLTGHSWRYKVATEDLNGDKVAYRAVRLPKYARFDKKKAVLEWTPRKNQLGMNDFIVMAIDEHGATSTHDFQVHVFHDPSSKQLVNTGWPLMLTFVGVVFAWGMAQI